MKKMTNIILCLLFIGLALSFLMILAGGGVLSDLNEALIEIKSIEEKGLISNPPSNTSSIALREIDLSKNSTELQKYIYATENNLLFIERFFYSLLILFIAFIFIRYYFRRN